MIPRQIAFCAALPITTHGKTDRRPAGEPFDKRIQIGVGDHHALWGAGAAGGKQDIGDVIPGNRRQGIVLPALLRQPDTCLLYTSKTSCIRMVRRISSSISSEGINLIIGHITSTHSGSCIHGLRHRLSF